MEIILIWSVLYVNVSFITVTAVFSKRLDGFRITSFSGVSLKTCRSLCEDRPQCMSVNYRRLNTVCELNSAKQTTANAHFSLSVDPGVVYEEVDRQIDVCEKWKCQHSETCLRSQGTCKVTECLTNVTTPTNGRILGNLNRLGARIKLHCESGFYIALNGLPTQKQHVVSTCYPDGTWSIDSFSCVACVDALITGPNGIKDYDIAASTYFDHLHRPSQGRLNTDRGWMANILNEDQYIVARFQTVRTVTGVQTQGRKLTHQWVKAYKVGYSTDCLMFLTVTNNDGSQKVFLGNKDRDTVVTNQLPTPLQALCVRLYPVDWFMYISMRFEILGCVYRL